MDWRSIPSLSSLRAFEAAARHESLSAAADELNVTHAAISQHVRALEADLGTALMARRGRGVALTAPGREFAAALSDGFGAIAEGVAALRTDEATRPLRLSLTPLFAENWLMPRLGDFWAKHPDIPLALDPKEQVVDLRRGGTDLAIRYGEGVWPGVVSEMLTPVQFVAVGRPGLLAKGGRLRDQNWFFEARRPEFRKWAESHDLIDEESSVETLETAQLTLAAVRQGYGLSVLVRYLMEADLANGTLELYCEGVERSPTSGYYMVHRPGDPPPRVRKLMAWLRSQVEHVDPEQE